MNLYPASDTTFPYFCFDSIIDSIFQRQNMPLIFKRFNPHKWMMEHINSPYLSNKIVAAVRRKSIWREPTHYIIEILLQNLFNSKRLISTWNEKNKNTHRNDGNSMSRDENQTNHSYRFLIYAYLGKQDIEKEIKFWTYVIW